MIHPVILATCYEGYKHLWPGFRYYIKKNKHFQAPIYLVSVNGNASDGDNSFFDIATGEGNWSDRLIAALPSIPSDHIFLLLEDYWISEPWDVVLWHRMCTEYWDDGPCDAVRWDQPSKFYKFRENTNRYTQSSPYTASLRPTMWSAELLKRALVPNSSAFDIERFGSHRINAGPEHYIYLEDWRGWENVHKMKRIGGRMQKSGYITTPGKKMMREIET